VIIERAPADPLFLLVLTHGAGGGVDAPDLLAARDVALRLGGVVARVTQPYRVRGARAPGAPARQDAAWLEVIAALRAAMERAGLNPATVDGAGPAAAVMNPAGLDGAGAHRAAGPLPLIQGGRSNGARVACRTAEAAGAAGVIALAFPLHPPGRPDVSRAAELRVRGPKVLVVNGERDPFGVPGRSPGRRVVVLPGETHALSRHPDAVAAAIRSWLPRVLRP
jgi:predicted alpha/beta-hydrolase family hydrolase